MRHGVTIAAPAKVNLHLEVGNRRPDGFHQITSLFQAVSLADDLTIRATGSPRQARVCGNFGFPMEENIISEAIRLFRAETGVWDGVEVEVEKRIPVAAGLGGGSSDAAAALRGLVALFDAHLTEERIRAIALQLGSDVPFFLQASAALVEGRGDRITPVAARTDFALAAVMPGVPVATADAYRALDARGTSSAARLSGPEVLRIYEQDPVASWRFFNSFDVLAEDLSPWIVKAREALLSEGARAARFTGSGSTVIGLFDDRRSAEACVGRLDGGGFSAVTMLPLALIPAVCYHK